MISINSSCRSSYGWSNFDKDGWTSRYYYTYYTTLGERGLGWVFFESLLYVSIMIISIIANATIILSIIRRKEMQTVTSCFIGNLACADLIFVLSIPAIIAARAAPSWNLGETTCKLLPYSQFVCGAVLLWTLTAISMDRVRCLTKAPYRSGLTLRTSIIIASMAWLIAMLIYLPAAIFFKQQPIQYNATDPNNPANIKLVNATICTLIFPKSSKVKYSLLFTIIMIAISCLIPMMIIIYNCIIIFRKLSSIQKKIEEKLGSTSHNKLRVNLSMIVGNTNNNTTTNTAMDSSIKQNPLARQSSIGSISRLQKHRRAVKILMCNIGAVLIMWLPITIVMILIYEDGVREDEKFFLSNKYFHWAVIIALLNTIVNPFLYGFLTENFRDHYPLNKWFKNYNCFKWKEEMDSDAQFGSSTNSKHMTFTNMGLVISESRM